MKFSEYPYARPDIAALKQECSDLAAAIKAAPSAQEQIRLYDEATEKSAHFQTMASLAYTRNTINTKDAFYDAEREYLDETGPELEEAMQAVTVALLDSPFRAELEAHYGSLLFKNLEIARRSFKPELIPLMQEAVSSRRSTRSSTPA